MAFGQVEAMAHRGLQLAYETQSGASPTFVWLGGFKSDMAGDEGGSAGDLGPGSRPKLCSV